MRVLEIADDVNTYMEIIFRIALQVKCLECDVVMGYYSCYYVNYKSNEVIRKIVIMRVKCGKCNKSHSIKPHFLASRHQYDTREREKYVMEYSKIKPQKNTLRKLQAKLFFNSQVSHTVMYYWARVLKKKKYNIVSKLVSGIQELEPSEDITDKYLDEAMEIPKETRNKEYSKDLYKMINWGEVYGKVLKTKSKVITTDNKNNPYIKINNFLDILTAHVFL